MRGLRAIPRRELILLAAAMALGVALRLAYVALTNGHALAGDEYEYDVQGRFIAAGQWFWSTTPYGIPHPSIWKPPGYSAWVGVLYSVVGEGSYDRVFAIQALLGAVVIGLSWLLARRLFGPKPAIAAAFLVAIYPLAWQYEVRLYSEALAVPLVLLAVLIFLEREPTPRRALALGGVMGLLLLVRPAAIYLFAGALVCWWLPAGGKKAIARTALAAGVALLMLVPWTVRNWAEYDEFIPISLQDTMVLMGTFNPDAANDPIWPYGWRPVNSRDAPLFAKQNAMPDDELRRRLGDNVNDFIADHPDAVPKSYFWNGLSRLWDVRRPGRALSEVSFEGRSKPVTAVGLGMYYVLLPLLIVGLWRLRSRRALVLPLLAIALAASVVHFAEGRTRYRAPLEPIICVVVCGAPLGFARRAASKEQPVVAPATA